MSDLIDGQQIFFGKCISNDDPLMLGRIRVEPETINQTALQNSNPKFDPNSNDPNKNGPWSDFDPFIYLPLLPYFVNQVPKVGEKVMLFYYNTKIKTGRNRFYMISTYSSPLTIKYEDDSSSQTRLSSGYVNSTSRIPPIKNQNGTYKNEKSNGVFPEPVDISLNGRGTADVVIKENDVLLRAGKHKDFTTGQIPDFEPKRAFFQLSKFDTDTLYGTPQFRQKLVSNKKPIKYLIEYDVLNPENQFSAFTGVIYFYQLRTEKLAEKTLTGNFNVTTQINLSGTTDDGVQLIRMITLPVGLNLEQLSLEIIQRLKNVITNPETALLQPALKQNEQFPFYYRPTKKVYDLVTNPQTGQLIASSNMSKLMSLVKISNTDVTPGFGLVIDAKLSPRIPLEFQNSVYVPSRAILNNNTAGLLGASRLFLLSNETEIEGKKKINFDKGIYGFEKSDILDDIEPNTSSMVRGEELLELLELIVRFCITHVHSYPGLPPLPTTVDQLTTDELLSSMFNAYQKVLNNNIRLN
jgi:uncharacterized protein Veg